MPARRIPTISREEMEAARDAIVERPGSPYGHRHLQRAADDPLELAQFIAEQHEVNPRQTLGVDVLDALTLLTYARRSIPALPAHLDSLELRLLRAGGATHPPVTLRALGERVGLSTRQATRARILSLADAENHRKHPDDGDLHVLGSRFSDQEAQWMNQHGEQLLRLTSHLVDARDRVTGDLSFELEQLGQTIAGIGLPPSGPHDYKRLTIAAARLRVMVLPELYAPEQQEFRDSLGPWVGTLARLAEDHQSVAWQSR
ncbi:hypothetical protein AAH991_36410 [Microbispora sp. ZYX-F-249]|uniref:MarR family transcriptional regulator n=1 Tax=Microbispora maris TaxID=3144104 RepID=A0ABV0B3W8_9ACTN